MWYSIEVRAQFFADFHEASLHFLTHFEADNHQALPGPGSRIDIFNTRDFPNQLFHRPRSSLLDLFGAESWHGYHDIDHRHLDLRLLLSRQQPDRCQAKQHRRNDQQWR